MHRFFVSPEALEDDEVVMSKQQAHQIRDVLRLKAGQHIVVLDNHGAEFEAALTKVSRDQVRGRVVEKRRAVGEPDVKITLYQSLLARDKFELVLQKCTEVGVARFVPMITQRSLVRECGSITGKKLGRWRCIITEAAEQSHRGRILELESPVNLEQGLDKLKDADLAVIASPEAEAVGLGSCLRGQVDDKPATVALFIGPEGGFTDSEIQRAHTSGAVPFSLGQRILRTETAAVVASSLILYELDELGP